MPLLPVFLALALCGGVLLALTTADRSRRRRSRGSSRARSARRWRVGRRRPWVVLACGLAGTCAAGLALGAHADRRARAPQLPALLDQVHSGGVVTLSGVLEEDASAGANGVRLRLAVHRFAGRQVDGAETAALTVGGTLAEPQMAQWRAGRTIRTAATLRRPAHYLNPGVGDDRLALARRGLTLVGSVKSGTLVEVQAPGTWRHERAADLRAHVRATLATYVRPRDPTAAAIATAILIGDRAGLDPALEKRLQIAGTYHVIAISGGNIAVLTAILLGLARLFRVAVVAWRPAGRTAAGAPRRAGGRRRIGRARDDDGGDLSGIARGRSVGVEPQRAGRGRRLPRPRPAAGGGGPRIRAQRRRHGRHHRSGGASGHALGVGASGVARRLVWWRRRWRPNWCCCRSRRPSSTG